MKICDIQSNIAIGKGQNFARDVCINFLRLKKFFAIILDAALTYVMQL